VVIGALLAPGIASEVGGGVGEGIGEVLSGTAGQYVLIVFLAIAFANALCP